jgi:hypothetical protein
MSGAARAACSTGMAAGALRGTATSALAVVTLHRAPRAARPGTTTVGRSGKPGIGRSAVGHDLAQLSLVMPSDAATPDVVFAAVGQVPGSVGTADAGVC